MEQFSSIVLLLLLIIAFENFAKGQLGAWLRAKVFNQLPGTPTTSTSTSPSNSGGSPTDPLIDPRKGKQ